MPEVVSIASVWRDRARVAEEAAAELDELVQSAASTVRWNYFGTDCVEGQALFAQLDAVLGSWRSEGSQIIEALRQAALDCGRAADAYAVGDEVAAGGIEY